MNKDISNYSSSTDFTFDCFQEMPKEIRGHIFENMRFFDLGTMSRCNSYLNRYCTEASSKLYEREVGVENPLKYILEYMPKFLFDFGIAFMFKALKSEELFRYCIWHAKLNVEMVRIYSGISNMQKNYLLVFSDIMRIRLIGNAGQLARECSELLKENKNLEKYAFIVGMMMKLRKYSDEGLSYLQLLESAAEQKISDVQLIIQDVLNHRKDLNEDQQKELGKLFDLITIQQSEQGLGLKLIKSAKKRFSLLIQLFTKHQSFYDNGVGLPPGASPF